jgi:hypothetical protein
MCVGNSSTKKWVAGENRRHEHPVLRNSRPVERTVRLTEFASMVLADVEIVSSLIVLFTQGKIMKVKTNLRAGASGATAPKRTSSVAKPVVFLYNYGPVVPVTPAWSRCAGIV